MKKCSTCQFWHSPHEGFWSSRMGGCEKLSEDGSKLTGVVEGCVNVIDRVSTFEICTDQSFGCVYHKTRKEKRRTL
jgi:hypothetical protein